MEDLLCLLGLFVQFGFSHGTESCQDDSRSQPWVDCEAGCCGEYPYHTCCTDWSDGAIIGATVGFFALVALIVTVCCCVFCKFFKQVGNSRNVTAPAVRTVQPAVLPSGSRNPSQPGYLPHPEYPPQAGYPPQPGYPSQPGYLPQAGYPPQPGNPPQSGYQYLGHTNQGYNSHISHPPPPAYNQLTFDPPPYGIQPSAPVFPTNGSTSFAADEKQHGFEHPPHPQAVNNDLVTEYYN